MYYKDTSHNHTNSTHIGILLLRIVIGGILLFHGISKLHDISFVKIQLINHALPSIWAYGVYIGEVWLGTSRIAEGPESLKLRASKYVPSQTWLASLTP